jgi:regulator of sigma E protease
MSHFLNLESLGAFAIVLGILILIHELGHFTVAKLLGIEVEVFSIGFGPRLLGFRRREGRIRFSLGPMGQGAPGTDSPRREPDAQREDLRDHVPGEGTDYRLSWLPLGGYVKMRGENPEEALAGDPREFLSRPKLQRFAVLVMGATTNILAAVVLMTVVYRAGIPEPAYLYRPAVVGTVVPDSPASKAGIQPEDRILRMGSKEIQNWSDLLTAVTLSPGQDTTVSLERSGERLSREIRLESVTAYEIGYAGILPMMAAQVQEVEAGSPADRAGLKPGDIMLEVNGRRINHPEIATRVFQTSIGAPVNLLVKRAGKKLDLSVVPADNNGQGRIGIVWNLAPEEIIRKYPLPGALTASVAWNWRNVDLVFTTLGKLFTRELSLRTMSGPIDIYKISGQTFREGWKHFLQFMALVSLQLGVINLLPFPVLDGGHIFILMIEGVARRDLSLRIKERLMQVGFYLLLLLMGTIIYLDIAKNSNNFQRIRSFFH